MQELHKENFIISKRKIVFGGFEEDVTYMFGVDCLHFNTNEFRLDPSSKWFNFKGNCAGLKYEFAVSACRPAVVWIRGSFPASVHDITIFRGEKPDQEKEDWDQSALYFKMQELGGGKKAIGDSGYAGEPDLVITKKRGQSADYKKILDRILQREETLHVRMKAFNVLGTRFRHGKNTADKMEFHGHCFKAVTVLIQYDYENDRPPFQVR